MFQIALQLQIGNNIFIETMKQNKLYSEKLSDQISV